MAEIATRTDEKLTQQLRELARSSPEWRVAINRFILELEIQDASEMELENRAQPQPQPWAKALGKPNPFLDRKEESVRYLALAVRTTLRDIARGNATVPEFTRDLLNDSISLVGGY